MKNIFKKIVDEELKTISVYGSVGTGKTCLCYSLLERLKETKTIYFFKHPKPHLIEALGYHNLDSLELIEELEDCVIYIDEPQLSLPIYDKKANRIIAQICSLSRQLGIVLIISTSDTRVFTKANEAFFDCWIIKDLDYDMVKNGSKIKKILQKNARFDARGLRLKTNEFLLDTRKNLRMNGKHIFEKPEYFTDEHSKPFKMQSLTHKLPKRIAEQKKIPKNPPENSEKSVTLQLNKQEVTNEKGIKEKINQGRN